MAARWLPDGCSAVATAAGRGLMKRCAPRRSVGRPGTGLRAQPRPLGDRNAVGLLARAGSMAARWLPDGCTPAATRACCQRGEAVTKGERGAHEDGRRPGPVAITRHAQRTRTAMRRASCWPARYPLAARFVVRGRGRGSACRGQGGGRSAGCTSMAPTRHGRSARATATVAGAIGPLLAGCTHAARQSPTPTDPIDGMTATRWTRPRF